MRAAICVIGEQGFDGASVRDIAARAGVSVAALYYHFPSKHDLLREYLEESWEVMLARIERRLRAAARDPFSQLDEYVSTLIASQLHSEFARLASGVSLREHHRLVRTERATVKRQYDRLHGLLEQIVTDGVSAGTFTTDRVHDTSLAIEHLSTSISRALAAEGRPLADIIEVVQCMAHALVSAEARRPRSTEFDGCHSAA